MISGGIRPKGMAAAPRTARLAALALACLAAGGAGRELVRESFTLDHLSSDWEVLLPVPDDVYPSGGVLRVVPAAAPDWGAHSRLPNLVRYRLPLAGSALEARAEVTVAIAEAGHGGALVLYQDDQNWVELAFRGERGPEGLERVLRLTRRAGGEEASVARRHGRGAADAPETVGLVLERAGERFTGRMEIPMGPPGVLRKGRVGAVLAPGLGDLQLVLKALRAREPAFGEPEGVVRFDDVLAVGRSADADLGEAPETLRVTYATDFRDATAFHGEFSVLRPEPGSLVLEDGLELVARYGIPGDRWTPIRNLVVRNATLPDGPFDVEVEVDARFTSRHDDVGIVLYGERGNALYLGHWALPKPPEGDAGARQAYLRTVEGGRGATRFTPDAGARSGVEATTLVFRIERARDPERPEYTAWVDVGGRGWVKVGEADIDLMEPRIGLFARSARDLGRVPGAGVRFARLWVMTEGR